MLAPLGVYARTSRRVSPHPVTLTQKHDALASHLSPLTSLPLTSYRYSNTPSYSLTHPLTHTQKHALTKTERGWCY